MLAVNHQDPGTRPLWKPCVTEAKGQNEEGGPAGLGLGVLGPAVSSRETEPQAWREGSSAGTVTPTETPDRGAQ